MKQIILIISIAIFSIILSSCTKSGDHSSASASGTTCTCTIGSGGGVSGTPYTSTTTTYPGYTSAQCASEQMTLGYTYGLATANNGYNGASCTLK